MILIPKEVMHSFTEHIARRGVAVALHADYLKWLRYFLDFCDKYPVPESRSERVRLFCEKLASKKQTTKQQQRAAHAVSLYFEMQNQRDGLTKAVVQTVNTDQSNNTGVSNSLEVPGDSTREYRPAPHERTVTKSPYQYNDAVYQVKSKSPEWDELLGKLADEIKVRHYSRKTLKTYANWSRQFQRFLRDKPPQELKTDDVKEYMTFLAVKSKVAASTQNQAFNSLLFLFRHAMKRDFGDLRDVPRAKKSLYVPVVLSREEIDAILDHLSYPFNLVVKVLFSCGLRQFECLNLRVRDFNFDAGVLTIHGKGKKDRTVPLPESILDELKAVHRHVNLPVCRSAS